jgi:superfamily II DNA or RNA helicase
VSVGLTVRLREQSPETEFQKDWDRQRRTAADILRRFDDQEGVILADQVGMGKTFVALAVAASQILATEQPGQVLVLAPAAVAEKWVQEWSKLSESLLTSEGPELRCVPTALRSGEALLAALDDPPERRNHLIVATHTALTSRLKDTFVQLAVLQAAVRGRPGAAELRARIARWCTGKSGLISDRDFSPAVVGVLLDSAPSTWRTVWQQTTGRLLDDDPVPDAVGDALATVDLTTVRSRVDELPRYSSKNITDRLRKARAELSAATQAVWKSALATTRLRLPLLIVDEAHRLKNDQTQISQLFAPRRVGADAGAMTGHFERMLLLTATPFELGHAELIRVLSRLSAVRSSPPAGADPLDVRLSRLSDVLRRAQAAAVKLDESWSGVDPSELPAFDRWTPRAPSPPDVGAAGAAAWRSAQVAARTRREMHDALQPWVIRHQREHRRSYVQGDRVALDGAQSGQGIVIGEEIALPFLLAARAQAVAADEVHGAARPNFAYGIASSFEAFRRLGGRDLDTDHVDEDAGAPARPFLGADTGRAAWYRKEIDDLLVDGGLDRARHPKISTTVDRAVDLWLKGDKCLVFCWFIRTGQAVEKALLERVDALTYERAASALGATGREAVDEELARLADRLLKRGSTSYDVIMDKLSDLLGGVLPKGTTGGEFEGPLAEIVIRHLRSPSYLVRFSPLGTGMTADDLWRGVCGDNPGGVDLRTRWVRFARRAAAMGADERSRVLEALLGEQTDDDTDADEAQGRGASLRAVRRAHGGTDRSIRERLITVFNTPFAPDLLVASSVMGEGIDLHRECRQVIHHDLDWNPSVLEQRTGRLDRIGALAESENQDIAVYEPYLAGTHDEKMFRVVKDRAGWFDVVMGRASARDEHATDLEERRQPLASSIVQSLEMKLESR